MLAPAPFWHRAAEWLLHAMAISAVVAIVLILVFIAKEAAPLFYSHEVRGEVTLGKMLAPQLWPGYDEASSIWQRGQTSHRFPRFLTSRVIISACSKPR